MRWKHRVRASVSFIRSAIGNSTTTSAPSLPNNNTKLPYELIIEIVEWICLNQRAIPDYTTLCAMSLVCRWWRAPAQSALFHRTVIEPFELVKALSRALTSSPHLGAYVHVFQIFPTTRSEDLEFAKCFVLLPNVQDLSLTTRTGFNNAGIDVLRNATCNLETFRFCDAILATQLLALPSWRTVQVLDYKPGRYESQDPVADEFFPASLLPPLGLPPPNFSLRELYWSGRYDRQLLWCISKSEQTLRKVALSDSVYWKTASLIVTTVGSSLRSLALEGTYYPELEESLRVCTNLEELKLGVTPSEDVLEMVPSTVRRLHFSGRHVAPGPLVKFIRNGHCSKLQELTVRSGFMTIHWEELREACQSQDIAFQLFQPALPLRRHICCCEIV